MGPGTLSKVLSRLPKGEPDPNLIIGYDTQDDAAVYKLADDIAMVQTLDFFPPMVEDPYTFGQVAAANALSDVWAMGGEVKTALNIVCFPQEMDINVLGEILRGGAEKVHEAGGILSGGHSINDTSVKYGLSVIGIVDPKKIYANDGGKAGDKLIVTKKLGVSIINTAATVGEASEEAKEEARVQMTTLNKYAADVAKKYEIHGCTDITGFGFLGHLHEMMNNKMSCILESDKFPYIEEAWTHAEEFLITAAAQKNRNQFEKYVDFGDTPFAMQEILWDPQTSGGLMFAVAPEHADAMLADLEAAGVPSAIVGEIIEKAKVEITVK